MSEEKVETKVVDVRDAENRLMELLYKDLINAIVEFNKMLEKRKKKRNFTRITTTALLNVVYENALRIKDPGLDLTIQLLKNIKEFKEAQK